MKWCLGDWLNFGASQKYGEKYDEAIAATGYDYKTLRNAKSICAKVELRNSFHACVFLQHILCKLPETVLRQNIPVPIMDHENLPICGKRLVAQTASQNEMLLLRHQLILKPSPLNSDWQAHLVKVRALFSN